MLQAFRIVPNDINIPFFSHRNAAFIFSGFLTLLIFIFLAFRGLNLGLDFTGGTIVEFESKYDTEEVRRTLTKAGFEGAIIQYIESSNSFVVRLNTKDIKPQDVADVLIKSCEAKVLQSDYVGPKVNDKLIASGIAALFWAIISMMAYISARFSLPYAICGVVALLHDLVAVLGFYAVTGYVFDLTSVAAILTVLGYSINDSVVIFDRIRENKRKLTDIALSNLINQSLNETLSRTTMTVFTTIIACFAIFLCGGAVLRGFSAAVMFGILFGAYSSIFISAPLLYYVNLYKKI